MKTLSTEIQITKMTLTKEFLQEQIDELDANYQVLKGNEDFTADAFYLKGQRDALCNIYNNYKF